MRRLDSSAGAAKAISASQGKRALALMGGPATRPGVRFLEQTSHLRRSRFLPASGVRRAPPIEHAGIEREPLLGLERGARVQAERATQLCDEILALVAHDLRNPLHTIAVGLETLLRLHPPDDDRATRQLVVMQRTVRSMNRLILDLLDVTRIEGGNFVLAREHVQVQPLLNEVFELFEASAREREISLTCHAPEGVPCVIGERDRLVQVLSNLIGNALKFTPPRGRISVHARLLEEDLHLSVEDTGPGIPSGNLPQLFDRFWQADRTGRVGTGLGLPIAKAIVEAHGGRIWAESVLGRGTTFHFTVPCARA